MHLPGLLALVLASPPFTASATSPVSDVRFASVLQAPPGTPPSLSALRGKTVVLEFWATWCAPCIGQLPHLNHLADAYRGRVQFIAVDDEPPAIVAAFVAQHPIRGWLAFDPDKAAFRRFGAAQRPFTVLIDAAGRIVSRGWPGDLTPAVLDAALRREPAHPRPVAGASSQAPMIRTADPHEHSILSSSDGAIEVHNGTATDILGLLYGANAVDIVSHVPLPRKGFDVLLRRPGTKEETLQQEVRTAFAHSLGVRTHWDMVRRDVLVLTAVQHGPRASRSQGTHTYLSYVDNDVRDTNVTMTAFGGHLGALVGMPVVDGTNAGQQRFDFDFALPRANVPTLLRPLAALGLRLVPSRRAVRTLVVDRG